MGTITRLADYRRTPRPASEETTAAGLSVLLSSSGHPETLLEEFGLPDLAAAELACPGLAAHLDRSLAAIRAASVP
jgi:hypothetical protein